MLEVRIPINENFEFDKCCNMYRKLQKYICDDSDFIDVITNTYFYAFYSENELIGCIYLYNKDNKLFLNGFASRGHHELNMEAMKMVEDWFSCDIYAETTNKLSSMCLHRLGYKKIDTNLYVKEKK